MESFNTTHMHWLDVIALLWFFSIWIGYHFYTARIKKTKTSLQQQMNHWREQWALNLMQRDNRIMDSQIINALIRKETFFASTTILILASCIALMGLKEKVNFIAQEIPFVQYSSTALWEIKVLVLVLIFVFAFFKFSWSIRQHSYSAILLGSVPEPGSSTEEDAKDKTLRLARLSSLGARNFNDGLRAYYFALAELSWFINPLVFILASTWVVAVLYRREFHSRALNILS